MFASEYGTFSARGDVAGRGLRLRLRVTGIGTTGTRTPVLTLPTERVG
jgi:hypothetical protein